MKFNCENELHQFEFHDAYVENVNYVGDSLVMHVTGVNIHKNTKSNPSDYDMEISQAVISFKNYNVESFEPSRTWKRDSDGQFYSDEQKRVFYSDIANILFSKECVEGFKIYSLEVNLQDGYHAIIEASGEDPYFTLAISFCSSSIQFDDFRGKAWYELHRQYEREVIVLNGNTEEKIMVHIICHDEDVIISGEILKAPVVSSGIVYGNKELWGRGHSITASLNDLAEKLPEGVKLLATDDINEIDANKINLHDNNQT